METDGLVSVPEEAESGGTSIAPALVDVLEQKEHTTSSQAVELMDESDEEHCLLA